MSFVFRATILNLVFNFLYIYDLAQSQSDRFAMVEKRQVVKACGPMLADLLSQTCSETYDNQEKRFDYLCKYLPKFLIFIELCLLFFVFLKG